jgi:integrase
MAVIKRKGRNWAVRFSYVDAGGTKQEYNKGGFKTKKQAEKHEQGVRVGINAAREELRRLDLSNFSTFGQFAERFRVTTLKANTRESGYATRSGRVASHIIPAIGHLPLTAIRKSHAAELVLELQDKGLGPTTINHCLALTKQILSDAVDERLIDGNPWTRVKRVKTVPGDWKWLEPEQMQRMHDAIRSDKRWRRWLLEILLGDRAGLRASEVAGLFVEDCDFDKGEVTIRRDVVRGQFQDCKSVRSRRTIRVPTDLLAELTARRRYALLRPEVVVIIKGQEHRGHLLSWNTKGKQHTYLPESVRKAITWACKEAGVPRITHRDLRHTYASHLRLAGVPLEDVRDLLGHHSIQMTLRYAHIGKNRFEEAANALERLVK